MPELSLAHRHGPLIRRCAACLSILKDLIENGFSSCRSIPIKQPNKRIKCEDRLCYQNRHKALPCYVAMSHPSPCCWWVLLLLTLNTQTQPPPHGAQRVPTRPRLTSGQTHSSSTLRFSKEPITPPSHANII